MKVETALKTLVGTGVVAVIYGTVAVAAGTFAFAVITNGHK